MYSRLPLLLLFIFIISCNLPISRPKKKTLAQYEGKLPLESIVLPKGFAIDIYAENVKNARSLCFSPDGTLFISTRSEGKVYAVKDTNNDYRTDIKYTLLSDGNLPNGVAFKDGDLYVAEVNRILRFNDIESNLENPGTPEVIFDQYPSIPHHGWKYIAFGPDGKLYVPVGAPCNICESEEKIFNSITRLNPDGTGFEIVHEGIRNTVGFTWHPQTKDLWFTDNGRDWLGDDLPACELNYAPRDGMHFGYPYCHQGDLPDPEFGSKRSCDEFTPPVQNLGPHSAPLGCEFYTANQFPGEYRDQIFIAEHGSWNRSKKIGYQVSLVRLSGNDATSYEPFAYGWLDKETDEVWGRPVDIELLPDGSMLVSDDFADVVYRIYYQ